LSKLKQIVNRLRISMGSGKTSHSSLEVCRNGFQLSHSFPFPQVSIPFQLSYQPNVLFPFPLFFRIDIDIPIPSHSHSHSLSPYTNDYVEQLMAVDTALSFTRHSTIALATQIHDTIFKTIHPCVTEDRNKSHYGPLCESRKQRSQSEAL